MAMSNISQIFCFFMLVTGLGVCLVLALREVEAAKERRREQREFIREAMRTVMTSTESGK